MFRLKIVDRLLRGACGLVLACMLVLSAIHATEASAHGHDSAHCSVCLAANAPFLEIAPSLEPGLDQIIETRFLAAGREVFAVPAELSGLEKSRSPPSP